MYQIGLGFDSFTLNFDRLNINSKKHNKSNDEFQHQVVSVEHIDSCHTIMQGDGYGFYDDFFAYDSLEGTNSLNDSSSSSASSSFYLESNNSKQLFFNDIESYSITDKTTMTNSSFNIIYESHVIESTPLACRTFNRFDQNNIPINEMTYISSDNYRIIESLLHGEKQATEYFIKLNINGADYVTWRSIDDIEKFINYCITNNDQSHFKTSLHYWNAIVKSRSYWWNMSSLIGPDYITKEHLQVKEFLVHVLFEIPCIETLFVLFN